MDEARVRELDTQGLCLLVSERHRASLDLECERLELAAVWADHYSTLPDAEVDGPVLPGSERRKALGGDGTPLVWEFAAAEFGALQQMSMYSASLMISDALDLRHRLPLIWGRVRAGEVRVWQACKIAQATRSLTQAQAGMIDRAMVEVLTTLPWSRCLKRLEAKVIEADPEAAEERAKAWAADRFVRTGKCVEGLTTIFARATAGDVIWVNATLDRIAAALALDGDTNTREVRRSMALGIMAQPARAMLLLSKHENTPCDFDCEGDSADDEEDTLADPRPSADAEPPVDDEPPMDPEDLSGADNEGDPWWVGEADLPRAQREDTPAEVESRREVALLRERLRTLRPADLLPPVTLYLHLHADTLAGLPGAVRFEDVGAITLGQLKDLIGTGCQLKLQPVIDLNNIPAADAYETPERIREALHLRNPAEMFPWGSNTTRQLDVDHTVNYRPSKKGGPPGQTRIGNLGLLSRRAHRVKTHGRWQLRQPEPGSYLWRSPHGWFHLVNASGTHELGRDRFAQLIWDAAKGTPSTDVVSRFERIELPHVQHIA